MKGHVVLVHAFPLSAQLWNRQADLMPEGWTLFAPELPGFGRSTAAPASSMDEFARAVFGAMDDVGIERAVIGGMSMGGYITFEMYRQAPQRFVGMILADTRATPDNDQQKDARRKAITTVREKGPSAIADDMIPKLLGETTTREQPGLVQEVRGMIERNSPDAIAGALEAMMGRPDSTTMLSRIDVPTLILCGDEDVLTPPADSQAMHAAIPGSRLEVIKGAGHLSNIERPAEFSAALASFLASRDLAGHQ
jgi:pimeloyl-ACP methyl ester carboxylesterase